MKISGIYKIINKINQKYYVGSSNDIEKRFRAHKQHLNGNYHTNTKLQNAWNLYNKNDWDWIIIENVSSNELLTIEQKYLDIAKTEQDKCYNLSFIAGRIEMTNETKEKISIKAISRLKNKENHPMFGKHHSNISREKIKNANSKPYKETYSDEKLKEILLKKSISCSGINNPMYGKHHSNETKLKQALRKKGTKHSEETKEKIGKSSRHTTIFNLKNNKTNDLFTGTKHDFIVKHNNGKKHGILYRMFKNINPYKGWVVLNQCTI